MPSGSAASALASSEGNSTTDPASAAGVTCCNSPTEVDASNAPGVYKITLTSTETQAVAGTLTGKSATAKVSIIPVQVAFERLPNAAPGSANGLPILDANGRVSADTTAISGDSVAADNAEAMFDGTGYAGGTVKLAVNTVQVEGGDATDSLLAAVTSDSTKLSAGALNTLASHDPGATIGTSTLTASQVWEYGTRSLTTFGSLVSDVATAVWSSTTRTLTSFGTLASDVASAVWSATSRTLTSFGTLVSDVATGVWSTSSRTLTSYGTLVTDIVSGVWSASSRTLTSMASIAADVWSYTTRTVTQVTGSVASVASGGITSDSLASSALTAMANAVDTVLSAAHGSGSWASTSGGTGSCTVTITLTTNTAVCPQVPFVIKSNPGGALQAFGMTDENGEAVVQLEPGDYYVYFGPDSRYQLTVPEDFTVTTDGDSVTFTCAAGTYPAQGLTFAEMRAQVLAGLYDHQANAQGLATMRQINETILKAWVRQAHYQVDADLQWTRQRITINSVNGQRRYTLDPDILNIEACLYDGAELIRIQAIEDIVKQDVAESTGDAYYWSWWANELCLYPTPDEDDVPITLYCLLTPSPLVDDTAIPSLPPHLHDLIVLHALSTGYRYMGDIERADATYAQYQGRVMAAKFMLASYNGRETTARSDEKVI